MASSRAINHFFRRSPMLSGISFLSPSCYCNASANLTHFQRYSNQKSMTKVDRNETGSHLQIGFAEVVKENTKSAWYVSVITAGVGITALMFYAIFKELFSSKSPNGVYSKAVERCQEDSRIKDALGEPIKAYGEETRRGRRGHVRHNVFHQNGVLHMRMQFHIQGVRKRGNVHLEVQENESGDYVYRYLFVELEDLGRNIIILEDNRESSAIPSNSITN